MAIKTYITVSLKLNKRKAEFGKYTPFAIAASRITGKQIHQSLPWGTPNPNRHNRRREINKMTAAVKNTMAPKKEKYVFETSPTARVSLSQEPEDRYKSHATAAPIIEQTAIRA